jgi:hypothetical protein
VVVALASIAITAFACRRLMQGSRRSPYRRPRTRYVDS